MSTSDPGRTDARQCFVCGPDNPIGLHVRFHLENDRCHAEFTPAAEHVGYDNVVHGGILYSLLDDVLGNWIFLQGARGFTARCDVRYRQPVEIGTRLLLEGGIQRRRGRVLMMEASARRASDQVVVVQCEARFMLEDADSLPA